MANVSAARNIAAEALADYRTGRETSADVLAAALEAIRNALEAGE
jgi:hypothetical protein